LTRVKTRITVTHQQTKRASAQNGEDEMEDINSAEQFVKGVIFVGSMFALFFGMAVAPIVNDWLQDRRELKEWEEERRAAKAEGGAS
jgi:hypothetical protein